MKFEKISLLSFAFVVIIMLLIQFGCVDSKNRNEHIEITNNIERLQVSSKNPHLLETISGTPVFINNYTAWQLIKRGSREDIAAFFKLLKGYKFNMVSAVILSDNIDTPYCDYKSFYGDLPFSCDSLGSPNPLLPIVTKGNDYKNSKQYDYWDHLDFTINSAAENGLYISLHPTWGKWVAGSYSKQISTDKIVFTPVSTYEYGVWLGRRYGAKNNIVWMIGGDRSAVNYFDDGQQDFREVWNALAEGLADGKNGVNNYDGQANYNDILISYHPRKWAANSSKWFHNKKWLAFNSIQDTPYDQIVSVPADYNLIPVKPTWLFEGRYEGATSAWAVRYQAYQTVLAGGFGHTYGSENWMFPKSWRENLQLPGVTQMTHIYTVIREIWTDKQFSNRMPDQKLIIGDQGDTKGDGMTVGDGDGGPNAKNKPNATSDRITAMRDSNGTWAMIYSANGRDITIDLTLLNSEKMDAYWFNPRTGMWYVNEKEIEQQTPFYTDILQGNKSFTFNAPGIPESNNDWLLILK